MTYNDQIILYVHLVDVWCVFIVRITSTDPVVLMLLSINIKKTDLSIMNIDYLDVYAAWFGLVLWYINHCRLFNAKRILQTTFLNESELILFHKYK